MKFIKTLERIDPENITFIHNGTLLQHLERYKFALEFCKNKSVLDAACGTGYGSKLIAETATKVLGIDVSKDTVQKNLNKFAGCQNLQFKVMDVCKLDIPDNSIDVIVSFETIEHLKIEDIKLMLNEFHRVLKNDGNLIISTPDVRSYSLNFFIKSNGYHLTEFTFEEFKHIMTSKFKILGEFYQDRSFQFLRRFLSIFMINNFMAVIFQKIWRGIKSVLLYETKVVRYSDKKKYNFIPMYNILLLKK